jgi:hypothetical protein
MPLGVIMETGSRRFASRRLRACGIALAVLVMAIDGHRLAAETLAGFDYW